MTEVRGEPQRVVREPPQPAALDEQRALVLGRAGLAQAPLERAQPIVDHAPRMAAARRARNAFVVRRLEARAWAR
jgi:hypothetical protein